MQFPSKIYIDGGDPKETKEADELLKKAGYHGLDGQTTNPSLIVKNLATARQGIKISMQEAFEEYKKIVQEMSSIIPDGKISIQVIGDPATMTKDMMLSQARERLTWIPNAIIKLPCTTEGLAAAAEFCTEGPINITLNFSEEQGAAVYSATKLHTHDVFISPFVGRFDDRGEKGMDFIANELAMLAKLRGQGLKPLLLPSDPSLSQPVSIAWTGPAGGALKEICLQLGYRYQEMGAPSAQPLVVVVRGMNRQRQRNP